MDEIDQSEATVAWIWSNQKAAKKDEQFDGDIHWNHLQGAIVSSDREALDNTRYCSSLGAAKRKHTYSYVDLKDFDLIQVHQVIIFTFDKALIGSCEKIRKSQTR